MSINHVSDKIKGLGASVASFSREIALSAIIILVGTASYGLGRLSVMDNHKDPIKLNNAPVAASASIISTQIAPPNPAKPTESTPVPASGYVASKTGSKYHLPECSGAKQIAEGNKVYFKTKAEAEAKGYAPAVNCKGI